MAHEPASDLGELFGEILAGPFIGIIAAVVQKICLELINASVLSSSEPLVYYILLLSIYLVPIIPVVGTFASAFDAQSLGGNVGVGLYFIAVLAAEALFIAPNVAMSVFFGTFVLFLLVMILR